MTREVDPRLAQLADTVAGRIREAVSPSDVDAVTALANEFLTGALVEDLENETPENLFGMTVSVWDHLRDRQPNRPKIRAFNPNIEEHGWHSPHSVVEIVNNNSPFLLDSAVSALNLLDITIHLVIHPVLDVRRDESGRAVAIAAAGAGGKGSQPESVIHIQITRQTGESAFTAITERLATVFADVRAAVEDWQPMLRRVDQVIAELREGTSPVAAEEVEEGIAFLEWLRDGNFTFLGARDYRVEGKKGKTFHRIDRSRGLGILREITKESRARHDEPISDNYAAYLRRPDLFVLSKAWTRSNVHRPVYMDYIGIRRFDKSGQVVGERRFLGLLTSTAYHTRPTRIPLLRRKVEQVLARSGFAAGDHDAKALGNILDNFPRDELFQLDIETLRKFAVGILHLEHRQRIRLFLRRDGQAQFYSALVFVPRDSYSTDLRKRMEDLMLERLNGHAVEVSTQFSEAPLVRAHFIVHVAADSDLRPDEAGLERELVAAARSWDDEFRDTLAEACGEALGARRHRRYAAALPASYKSDISPRAATADVARMEKLKEPGDIALNLYRRVGAEEGEINFKIYHLGDPIPLSRILPMLEHMGLVVNEERPYAIPLDENRLATLHDFRMHSRTGADIDIPAARARFEGLFDSVRSGELESDAFNGLVQEGLDGREISLIRAYAKYLRQIKAPFSLPYMQETLAANPELARLLVAQFRALHDPEGDADHNMRAHEIRSRFVAALDQVSALDQDRILRRFLNLVDATLRTNFFQRDADGQPRPAIALKFDTVAIADLPEPRPWREIFVYSPRFEGVHLRGGPVARGGIRWSDRREDFRTEILGLVKAQMVKNAVIVPVGAKGGFVLKQPPADGAGFREEGLACYRLFMASLLDVTDNLVAGEIEPPEQLVAHDPGDPYLVVAADKGTATFSDEANAVAARYSHWLGDAYASGGSDGYDHKAMGITARGAWEAVKRHFRELGRDIQSEAFTVVGVGDMSGDVFGNGMLLSPHIRLVGAFNHLHIFLDPEPDAEKTFAERERLFALPRSGWTDFDSALISEGGGVFSRQAKSIEISPQIAELLDIPARAMPPNELIRAMLRAEVDLLWNGGIGTYIKSASETHAAVDDRANDALRVNADALRCKVIGEGGNLGVTQAGRIEFALRGGKINTDAIDNSAGVDCSDHEVNIKVLLGAVADAGEITGIQRNRLLAEMTDEVAALVLRHNYVQTQCLSFVETLGPSMFEQQLRHMRALEAKRLLHREVEGLPNDEEIAEWRGAGRLFTRPELAVLLAYAKMDLYDSLLKSSLPDDAYLRNELFSYFPVPLRERFAAHIENHTLRREIIATRTSNEIIDRAGITFVHRHTEHSGIAPEAVVTAFFQTREVFGFDEIWRQIEATDNVVTPVAQSAMHVRLLTLADNVTPWFLRNVPAGTPTADVVAEYRGGVAALDEALDDLLDEEGRSALEADMQELQGVGATPELASALARLRPLSLACDIVLAAREAGAAPVEIAGIFFEVGRRYACDWLRRSAERVPRKEHWDKLAAQSIAEDSHAHQRALTSRVLAFSGTPPAADAIDAWARQNAEQIRRFESVFEELRGTPMHSLSMLNVVNRSLRVLAETV